MRPEATQDGNPLFMNCDFFREQTERDITADDDDVLDTDEIQRMREHERECLACVRWLIERLSGDDLPKPVALRNKNRLANLRRSRTRLERKARQSADHSRNRATRRVS